LGPDHLLLRFRPYREYPTEEQARWRIIELLEVGFRPRRIAALLAIAPHVVYYWQRRFTTFGLVGLTTRSREETAITTRVSVQAMMEVFQLLDNVRDHRGLSTACDVTRALTFEVRLPIRTSERPL
jgi:hypothetical protein